MSAKCPHCGDNLALLSEVAALKLSKFVPDVEEAIEAIEAIDTIDQRTLSYGTESEYFRARREALLGINCLAYYRLDTRRTQAEVKYLLKGLEEQHEHRGAKAVQAVSPEARFFHTTQQLETVYWIRRLKEVLEC